MNYDEAIRVSTGAPLPDGADAVVQVEDTTILEVSSDGNEEVKINILSTPSVGQDIRYESGSACKIFSTWICWFFSLCNFTSFSLRTWVFIRKAIFKKESFGPNDIWMSLHEGVITSKECSEFTLPIGYQNMLDFSSI